jgi:hypothetical protein
MARVISFLEDETMSQFQGKRFTHEYTHNVAPPETVFPLLYPVREAGAGMAVSFDLL